jgi:hypothetical protein
VKAFVVGLASVNLLLVLVTWYYYFRVWWATSGDFEGAVPFHVVMVGLSYVIFAGLALEHVDGWRGLATLFAYAMATGSLAWVLYYERMRFLTLRRLS